MKKFTAITVVACITFGSAACMDAMNYDELHTNQAITSVRKKMRKENGRFYDVYRRMMNMKQTSSEQHRAQYIKSLYDRKILLLNNPGRTNKDANEIQRINSGLRWMKEDEDTQQLLKKYQVPLYTKKQQPESVQSQYPLSVFEHLQYEQLDVWGSLLED